MSGLDRFTSASFLTFVSQKQGIIYCPHWDLALTISAHVLVDGAGLWIHQKMICKLYFLALLSLLKQPQTACSGSLERGPKTCVSALNVCGKWCFGLRQMKEFAKFLLWPRWLPQKLTFPTFSSEVTAQVILLHPLENEAQKATASKSAIERGTCLACLWKRRNKREACQWGCWMRLLCTPGFFKAWHTFLENRGSGMLFPGIPQLSVSWVSKCSLPLCTQTNQINK